MYYIYIYKYKYYFACMLCLSAFAYIVQISKVVYLVYLKGWLDFKKKRKEN